MEIIITNQNMKFLTLRNSLLVAAAMSAFVSQALDHPGITSPELSAGRFTLVEASIPVSVCVDPSDNSAVQIAAKNLCEDFGLVTGNDAAMVSVPEGRRLVIAGTVGTPLVDRLIKDGKISSSELKGKNEKYVMTVVAAPFAGVEEALVIAGSDRRGTVYGIYELSEQIGVSPWYDWADVPVSHHDNLSMEKGTYTAGEPAVKYRGIFLNDEAPCLTGWVKNTYGTGYGDHRFYERVFELILRLRGNFMWPAMWGWLFMPMMLRMVLLPTAWVSSSGHLTMSLWGATIRSGRAIVRIMGHGIMPQTRKYLTNSLLRAWRGQRAPRMS